MTGVGDQGEGLKTARPEIEVLGSADGTVWEPFVFRYKPGPLHRSPPWVAPHQPRLAATACLKFVRARELSAVNKTKISLTGTRPCLRG